MDKNIMKRKGFQIIEIRSDGAAACVYEIADGESIIVGRSQTNADFVLQDPAISRSHLRFECREGQLFAENLSSYGSSLDGCDIQGKVEVKAGQIVMLGKNTRLSIVQTDSIHPTVDSESRSTASSDRTIYDSGEKTSEATRNPAFAGKKTGLRQAPVPPLRAAPLPSGLDTNSEMVYPPVDLPGEFEGTIELGTMIRPIGSTPTQNNRKTVVEKSIIVLFLLLVAGIIPFLFRSKLPPKPLSWPVDKNGNFLDEKISGKSGFFSVLYPGVDNAQRQISDGGFVVEYTIDRVPFRLWYNEIDLGEQVFADNKSIEVLWKDILPDKENWNFERSMELPIFIGAEQGIPMSVMQYYRTGLEGKNFGVVQMVRFGAVLGSVCIEIPEKDQLRGEQLILNYYILIEPELVKKHWQGDGKPLRSEPASELLKLARHEITRDAPAIWEQVETILLDTVRKAFAEKNQTIEKEAINMLTSLRTRKTTWFHAMKLKKNNFERQNKTALAQEIAHQCQLVFSSPTDQRFYEVRNW